MEFLVPIFQGVVDVIYSVGVRVVERVVLVVGGVDSYKCGEVGVVMYVEYSGVVVERMREEVVITCIAYGVSPYGAADTRS